MLKSTDWFEYIHAFKGIIAANNTIKNISFI